MVERNIQRHQSSSLPHRGKIETREALCKSNFVYLKTEAASSHHEFSDGKVCQTAGITMSNILPNEKSDSSHPVLSDVTINQE